MAYRIVVLPSAESDLEQLDPEVRRRILRRTVWLGENAPQVIHHPLVSSRQMILTHRHSRLY